jgi:hypothetical protein
LDTMARQLVDKEGMPINKWHLFGITDKETLLHLPVYSADSAGWLRKAVIGSVDVWDEEANELFPIRICGEVKDKTGHFSDLPPHEKSRVEELISKSSFTLEQLKEKNANARIGFNIQMWKKYEEWLNSQRQYPWPIEKRSELTLF